MSDGLQRVRLVVEYDAEIFDDDPNDAYSIAQIELEEILANGFDCTLPDPDKLTISVVPIFEVHP